MTDDDIITYVLQFEGGYTDNPSDHGGPTNFGITASDFGRFLGLAGPATAEQVSNMTQPQAVAIYSKDYIAEPGFDSIADGAVRLVVVDSGVLFGTGRAARWLQQALGVGVDGVIGADTCNALGNCGDTAKLARDVLALRFRAIADIVARDQSQLVFLRGWISRAATLLGML